MIYLNYAALCPTHPEVEQAVESTLQEFRQYLYSDAGIEWYQQRVLFCRRSVAQFLHLNDPSSIAFVPNASTAHYLTLASIEWQPGDCILSSTHENPSITREILALQRKGVNSHFLKPTSPDDLVRSINDIVDRQNTRAIILSHVSHVDGRILPIADIGTLAKEKGILFMVDGAQAAGHIPLDLAMLDYDIYFFPGHKWCCGPLGTGVLVMNPHFVELNPSFGLEQRKEGYAHATRFEIGTHNIGLITGLAKACELKRTEDLQTDRLTQMRKEVIAQLRQIAGVHINKWEGPHSPGIVNFQCRQTNNHQTLMRALSENEQVVVKQFIDYPEDEVPAIRMSWSHNTPINDMTSTLETIERALT